MGMVKISNVISVADCSHADFFILEKKSQIKYYAFNGKEVVEEICIMQIFSTTSFFV